METKPTISIVMSVYNGSEFLHAAIDSILNQSYQNFEFIIINDASTESTEDIVKSYTDSRIVYVRNSTNLGLTANLNKGLALARGEFVARQDDDDVSSPDRLEKQLQFLVTHPDIMIVGSIVNLIDREGKVFSTWRMPTEDKEIKELLNKGSAFCHGAVLFRKVAVDTVGGYREKAKYVEDYDLWLRLAERYQMANIEQPLYSLRRSISSISTKNLDKQIGNHLLVRALSKERRETGRDSLDGLVLGKVQSVLVQKYKVSIGDINIFKAQYIKQYYVQAIQTGSKRDAIKFGWLILKAKPSRKFAQSMFKQLLWMNRIKKVQ
ncbi:MAG: glycosyltransferase [Candidatus Omnitrophica bacterium]|nr:glycosyltransferase [Candidatus Omnitrophota bacterium]